MKISSLVSISEWKRVFRFYQAGIVNAFFGYSSYALLVALGMNMFLSQLVSHILGMLFNFFTYKNYVFHDRSSSIFRYVIAYIGQYVVSLSALAAAHVMRFDPYMAGFLAIILISVVNFFVLKFFVYIEKAKQ